MPSTCIRPQSSVKASMLQDTSSIGQKKREREKKKTTHHLYLPFQNQVNISMLWKCLHKPCIVVSYVVSLIVGETQRIALMCPMWYHWRIFTHLLLQKLNRKMHLSKIKHSKFNESGQLLIFYLVSAIWGADILFRVSPVIFAILSGAILFRVEDYYHLCYMG